MVAKSEKELKLEYEEFIDSNKDKISENIDILILRSLAREFPYYHGSDSMQTYWDMQDADRDYRNEKQSPHEEDARSKFIIKRVLLFILSYHKIKDESPLFHLLKDNEIINDLKNLEYTKSTFPQTLNHYIKLSTNKTDPQIEEKILFLKKINAWGHELKEQLIFDIKSSNNQQSLSELILWKEIPKDFSIYFKEIQSYLKYTEDNELINLIRIYEESCGTLDLKRSKNANLLLNDFCESPELLGRDRLSGIISKYISNKHNSGKTFGIFGEWGIGKTHFVNQIKNNLPKNYYVCEFDGWKYRDSKSSESAIIHLIITQIINKRYLKLNSFINRLIFECQYAFKLHRIRFVSIVLAFLFSVIALFISHENPEITEKITISLLDIIKNIQPFLIVITAALSPGILVYIKPIFKWIYRSDIGNYLSNDPITNKTSEEISNILNNFLSPKRKMVFIIDNLDRCNEDVLLKTIDSIKNLLDNQYVFVVIAADEEIVLSNISSKYEDIEKHHKKSSIQLARNYIEKIISIPINLKHLPTLSFSEFLRRQYEASVNDNLQDISSVLTPHIDMERPVYRYDHFHQADVRVSKFIHNLHLDNFSLFNSDIISKSQLERMVNLLESFKISNPRTIKRILNAYEISRDYLENLDNQPTHPLISSIILMEYIMGLDNISLSAEHLSYLFENPTEKYFASSDLNKIFTQTVSEFHNALTNTQARNQILKVARMLTMPYILRD